MAHYTYGVVAYNYRTQMDEVQPITFTNKLKACEYGCSIKRLGAKNVKVVCDQTKKVTLIL